MVDTVQSVVTTVKLTKVFRDFWLREKVAAVVDLDLDVLPHEVFGLLGPNGSGKSTTLKMILGLLFPTRGRISVMGKSPADVRIKSRIGFLPEESYLYPFLDARETLDFYGRLFHQPRRERLRRIDMLLDMVGLSSVATRRVGEYSKGMQRRIGLAQALINDPDLLILDEPTAGMDPIGTRQFKDLIRTLGRRGKTVILSSHLLADVEDVCDRVCILYGGRQRASGRVSDLLSDKNRTRLTIENVDAETLEAIEQTLASRGREILEVTPAREKLESLFLRIVTEAQEQKLATGGALVGELAEFLRDGEDQAAESVIEDLVAAGSEKKIEPSELPPPPPLAAPQPALEVLQELVSSGEAERQPSDSTGQTHPTERPEQSDADRDLLDELTRSGNDGKEN